MTPYQNAAWLKIGIDAWTLGWQATRVMGLRTAKAALTPREGASTIAEPHHPAADHG